jgi:hypothetical protein
VVLAHARYMAIPISDKIVTYALWLMAALFLLNTLGNAVSKNKVEQSLFTPLTILLAMFSILLALSS